MCLADSVPPKVVRMLLSDWLILKEIVLVDSAFCNKSQRPLYHSCFLKDQFMIYGSKLNTLSEVYLEWLHERKMKVKHLNVMCQYSIKLRDFCTYAPVFDLLQTVKTLTIHYEPTTCFALVCRVLKSCRKMCELTLIDNKTMQDFPILSVASFSTLRVLHLVRCKGLTDLALFHIADTCNRLVQLSCVHCDGLTYLSLQALIRANSAGLKTIKIHSGKAQFSKEVIPIISTESVQITSLDLSLTVHDISMLSVTQLSLKCKNLKSLALKQFSVRHIYTSQHAFHKLSSLDMSANDYLAMPSVLVMVRASPRLTSLNISRNSDVSDRSISDLCALCHLGKTLQMLDISHCTEITDAALHSIGANLLHLVELKVNCCKNITSDGVSDMLLFSAEKENSSMKTLWARHCWGISRWDVDMFELQGLTVHHSYPSTTDDDTKILAAPSVVETGYFEESKTAVSQVGWNSASPQSYPCFGAPAVTAAATKNIPITIPITYVNAASWHNTSGAIDRPSAAQPALDWQRRGDPEEEVKMHTHLNNSSDRDSVNEFAQQMEQEEQWGDEDFEYQYDEEGGGYGEEGEEEQEEKECYDFYF